MAAALKVNTGPVRQASFLAHESVFMILLVNLQHCAAMLKTSMSRA